MNPKIPSLLEMSSSGPTCLAGNPHERLISTVDSFSELRGAGIMLVDEAGTAVMVRGGPQRQWVWIAPQGAVAQSSYSVGSEHPAPQGFWDRWGGSVLSCSAATATGAVIWLSGGTASLVVGVFAVNSALLCGTSVGKAIAHDSWTEFEREGGGAYTAWMTVETALSLMDLANGAKGAIGLLRNWQQVGKLAKLQQAVGGRKLTRKQLLKVIQDVEPDFKPNLSAKGTQYVSRSRLVGVGEDAMRNANFVSLNNHRARVITGALGDATTLGGARDAMGGGLKTYDAWLVVME